MLVLPELEVPLTKTILPGGMTSSSQDPMYAWAGEPLG
jgi:hypothetical protein